VRRGWRRLGHRRAVGWPGGSREAHAEKELIGRRSSRGGAHRARKATRVTCSPGSCVRVTPNNNWSSSSSSTPALPKRHPAPHVRRCLCLRHLSLVLLSVYSCISCKYVTLCHIYYPGLPPSPYTLFPVNQAEYGSAAKMLHT
jgi:hypothetical protein